jgi:hypothetical protein
MNVKILMGLAVMFVLLTVISGISEQVYAGTEVETVFGTLLNPSFVVVSPTTGLTTLGSIFSGEWIGAVWKMLTFDYAMFQGSLSIFRYLFCCISMGVVWGILQTLLAARLRW